MLTGTLQTWITRQIAVRQRLERVCTSSLLLLMVVTTTHSLQEAARFSGLHPSIHRWLTDLEHTACGLRRPHAVRGWREVTCQRVLQHIHAKLAQLQRQPPASPRATPARAAVTRSRGSQHS